MKENIVKNIVIALKAKKEDKSEKSLSKDDKKMKEYEELHDAKKLAAYEFFDAIEKKCEYKLCSSLSDLLTLIAEEEKMYESDKDY